MRKRFHHSAIKFSWENVHAHKRIIGLLQPLDNHNASALARGNVYKYHFIFYKGADDFHDLPKPRTSANERPKLGTFDNFVHSTNLL